MISIRWMTSLVILLSCLMITTTATTTTIKSITTTTSAPPSTIGIQNLVSRLFGTHISSPFIFSIDPISTFNASGPITNQTSTPIHAYEISSVQGNLVIQIRGTDLISLAAGLNYYLKYFCNLQVRSWTETDSDENEDVVFTYPSPLPVVKSKITVRTGYEWNYYMNVCTFSYSQVWWTFTRWSRELDWMALNGINLALAFTGQEKIVMKLYQDRYNLNYTQLTDFFGGPAFLAWARMGNIQGSWNGGLPLSWIEAQHQLQLRILDRMDELGITPVLPAFNGFVPKSFAKLFPSAKIHATIPWSHFQSPYSSDLLLDPTDPLFQEIGELYIRTQSVLYGNYRTNYYNADTFNENTPPSHDAAFLRNSSAAVYASMTRANPNAVWIMQAWLFIDHNFWQAAEIEALLSGVPYSGMILLDLEADARPFWSDPRTKHFGGKRFIWNMLHNFGGNVGLGGRMSSIVNDSVIAFHNTSNHMIGVGMTPEGINQNYIVYELMAEVFWHSDIPIKVSDWINHYITRRYGSDDASITWIGLAANGSVYDAPATQIGVIKSLMELRPKLDMTQDGFMGTTPWYKPSDVIKAVHTMLLLAPKFGGVDSFRYDLVDLMRQALSDRFQTIHRQLTDAYHQQIVGVAINKGIEALHLYDDMDRLLSSDRHFLFGRWIASARNWAHDHGDIPHDYFEYQARNQITMWGPHGEVHDYAAKQWSGVMSSFYAPRYSLWIQTIVQQIVAHVEVDQNAFDQASIVLETKWQTDNTPFPTTPQTDSIQVVSELYNKYFASTLAEL